MSFTRQVWDQPIKDSILGGYFYDNVNSGANPILAYSPVSLGNATDVTNALAAGVTEAALGNLYVPTPISSGLPTRRVVGIALGSTYSGKAISVLAKGIGIAICNAAVTADTLLFATVQTTLTNAQAPITALPRTILQVMKLPNGTTPTLTYNVGLVSSPTITPAAGATANVLYYPLGYALLTTANQYDLVPFELACTPFYA